jgi:hypothetical protein
LVFFTNKELNRELGAVAKPAKKTAIHLFHFILHGMFFHSLINLLQLLAELHAVFIRFVPLCFRRFITLRCVCPRTARAALRSVQFHNPFAPFPLSSFHIPAKVTLLSSHSWQ